MNSSALSWLRKLAADGDVSSPRHISVCSEFPTSLVADCSRSLDQRRRNREAHSGPSESMERRGSRGTHAVINSAASGFDLVAKMFLVSRPTRGRRLSCPVPILCLVSSNKATFVLLDTHVAKLTRAEVLHLQKVSVSKNLGI